MGNRKFQLDQAGILLCEGTYSCVCKSPSQMPVNIGNSVKNSLFTLINSYMLIMFFTWIFSKFIKGDIFAENLHWI